MIMQSGFTFWNFLVDVFVIFLFIMWIWLLICKRDADPLLPFLS